MTSVETQHGDRGIGTPPEQRKDFRRAFNEYGWARPGTERPVARPHITLVVATISTVVALLAGVTMQLIKPVKLAKPAPPRPKAAAPAWSAISGWDCAASTDRGFDADSRLDTWMTIGRGGWSDNGCHGTYEAIPFTSDKHMRGPMVQWWFNPGDAMRKCVLSVYVPTPDRATFAPVSTVRYSVLGARSGTEFARFTVDQTKRPGSWVVVGSYPVNRSGIAVRLNTAGKPAAAKSMMAVTQVKAACTG